MQLGQVFRFFKHIIRAALLVVLLLQSILWVCAISSNSFSTKNNYYFGIISQIEPARK